MVGGYGSGRNRWRNSGTVGGYRFLDVRELHRKGWLRPGIVLYLTWSNAQTGEQIASVGLRTNDNLIVLSYRHSRDGEEWQNVEETVKITWTPCNYGGRLPWFICPGVVNGVACRRRVGIVYLGGSYRMRLGGSALLSDMFPWKPKHMRWSTYQRLRSEAELAEARWLVKLDAWIGKFQR